MEFWISEAECAFKLIAQLVMDFEIHNDLMVHNVTLAIKKEFVNDYVKRLCFLVSVGRL
jgi:hypothetical protein